MKAEFQFTPEDLQTLRGLIREELREELASMKKEEPKFYTREEAAQLLKISLPTLHAWANKGLITKSKIGNRVLIEDAEIQRMILKMKNH
jgi:excisionase family DNA binding protein